MFLSILFASKTSFIRSSARPDWMDAHSGLPLLFAHVELFFVVVFLLTTSRLYNKTCHRGRTARLTHHIKNVKRFANADTANAGGSTISLPGLRPGELKMTLTKNISVFTVQTLVALVNSLIFIFEEQLP